MKWLTLVVALAVTALAGACEIAHRTHVDSVIEGELGGADPVRLEPK